jgi:hypothetical protein
LGTAVRPSELAPVVHLAEQRVRCGEELGHAIETQASTVIPDRAVRTGRRVDEATLDQAQHLEDVGGRRDLRFEVLDDQQVEQPARKRLRELGQLRVARRRVLQRLGDRVHVGDRAGDPLQHDAARDDDLLGVAGVDGRRERLDRRRQRGRGRRDRLHRASGRGGDVVGRHVADGTEQRERALLIEARLQRREG